MSKLLVLMLFASWHASSAPVGPLVLPVPQEMELKGERVRVAGARPHPCARNTLGERPVVGARTGARSGRPARPKREHRKDLALACHRSIHPDGSHHQPAGKAVLRATSSGRHAVESGERGLHPRGNRKCGSSGWQRRTRFFSMVSNPSDSWVAGPQAGLGVPGVFIKDWPNQPFSRHKASIFLAATTFPFSRDSCGTSWRSTSTTN